MAATVLPNDAENTACAMNKYRLPDSVVPTHYDIKLILHVDDDNSSFDGESSITVQVRRLTNSLYLHAMDLTIDEAATKIVDSNGDSYVPTTHNHDNVTEMLAIEFENDLSPGKYILHLNFGGNFQGRNDRQVATQFKPISARRTFPCWDEPALKATFNISIKHNRNDTALSNMPIREQTDDGADNDTIWTHFETTPIMSTYLVAFVVLSDFTCTSNEDGTINTWGNSDDTFQSEISHKTALAFAQWCTECTNVPIKIPKINQVQMPSHEVTPSDTENWGLILYNNDYLISGDIIQLHYEQHMMMHITMQKMIHQWFGNVVSPSWWSHVWLNEGLATFLADYIMNLMNKWKIFQELYVVNIHQPALHVDITKNMQPLTLDVNTPEEITELFTWLKHGKAQAILRMLQHIVTDDVFQKGLIKYLNAHQFGSATSDNFWSAMQDALDESDVPHNDYNVKEVMDTWINQSRYPVVHVTRNYENGDVILTQKQFRSRNETDPADDKQWWIPITFATRSNPDFSNTLPTQWLRPQDENLVIKGIDLDDWIIINLQETGYYRVQYDFPNWYKIAEYLNSDEYEKIHVLNRAQILDDFYHLMAHPFDLVRFKELANYLHRETNFLVGIPICEFVAKMEDFNDFPDIHSLKIHLIKLINAFIKRYLPENSDDPFESLGKGLDFLVGYCIGNTKCGKMLQNITEESEESEENAFKTSHPTVKLFTLMWHSSGICEIEEVLNESESSVLQNSWFENPDIFINLLNTSASDNTLSDSEYSIIYNTIVQKHADNESVLDYLLANIDKTTFRGCIIEQILEKIINNVHSTGRLEKISNFVKDNFDNETVEWTIIATDKRKAEL